MSIFMMRIHALASRLHMYQFLGSSRLEYLVFDKLAELGWYNSNGRWRHQVLQYDFCIDEIRQPQCWKRIGHWLRQSRRWQLYEQLCDVQRREFEGAIVPDFAESRIDLARVWAKRASWCFPGGMWCCSFTDDEERYMGRR